MDGKFLKQIALIGVVTLALGQGSGRAQDVFSATGVIITRSFVRTAGVRVTTPRVERGRRRPPTPTRSNALEISYLIDDAIALGNAQREAQPPRYPEAERAYQLAAKLKANDARPHAWLGDLYLEQQQFAAAESALRRAVSLDPSDAISYVRLSYMFSKVGRFDEADEAARRVQTLRPQDYYGFCSLGWSKFKRKNFAEAEVAYRRAIELSPKTAGLYSDLALILLNRNRANEAADFLQRALSIDPDHVPALINYGVLLQKAGQIEQAKVQYERAIVRNVRATQASSNLGMINYLRGNFAEAKGQWDASIKKGSTYSLDRVGLHILNGNLRDANLRLESFVKEDESNVDGWLLLSDVRRALGDKTGARVATERAALIAPGYARISRPNLRRTV